MILRLLNARVRPGVEAELVRRLREQAVPEALEADGLIALNYGLRRQGSDLHGLSLALWEDYQRIIDATEGRPDRINSSTRFDDLLADVTVAHYEVTEAARAREGNPDGTVIGLFVAKLLPHVEQAAFDVIRESTATLDAAGTTARYVGRRVAGSHSEVAVVVFWPDRAALREYVRNHSVGIVRPDLAKLVVDWAFETYDSASAERLLISSAGPAVLLADDEGLYVDVSPGMERVFGLPSEFMLGKRVWDFTPAVAQDLGRQLWAGFVAGGSQAGTYDLARPDGSVITVRYRAQANCPQPGLHASVLSLPTDPPDERPVQEVVGQAFDASGY